MRLETLTNRYFSAYAAREDATTHKQERAADARIEKALDAADRAGLTEEFLIAIGINTPR